MQGYKFVLMNQDGSSNFPTFNWIWGLLIHSSDQTDFRLDSMSYGFLTFVIKLGLITLCIMCLNTFEFVHSRYWLP